METKEEIWKPIAGWDNSYEISTHGRVRSKLRYVENRFSIRPIRQRIIVQQIGKNGYASVRLAGKMAKQKYVHRLVCEAFIPNPENLPQVNHKDGNRLNNNLYNLEWCTQKDNLNDPARISKLKIHSIKNRNNYLSKPVIRYDMNGSFVAKYSSLHEAERVTGILQNRISQACRKKGAHITCSGSIWRFDGDVLTQEDLEQVKKSSINPVLQYDLNMNLIAEHRSSCSAAALIGCNPNGINLCCRGLQKTCYGFIWERKYK